MLLVPDVLGEGAIGGFVLEPSGGLAEAVALGLELRLGDAVGACVAETVARSVAEIVGTRVEESRADPTETGGIDFVGDGVGDLSGAAFPDVRTVRFVMCFDFARGLGVAPRDASNFRTRAACAAAASTRVAPVLASARAVLPSARGFI